MDAQTQTDGAVSPDDQSDSYTVADLKEMGFTVCQYIIVPGGLDALHVRDASSHDDPDPVVS